jgi:hypothetical protein
MVLGRKELPMRGHRSRERGLRAEREVRVREWLAVREREGLTFRELSKRSGIGIPKLLYWDRKGKNRQAFVEVEVTPASASASRDPFEVMLRSGERVLVPARFDAASLRELISVLEGARC